MAIGCASWRSPRVSRRRQFVVWSLGARSRTDRITEDGVHTDTISHHGVQALARHARTSLFHSSFQIAGQLRSRPGEFVEGEQDLPCNRQQRLNRVPKREKKRQASRCVTDLYGVHSLSSRQRSGSETWVTLQQSAGCPAVSGEEQKRIPIGILQCDAVHTMQRCAAHPSAITVRPTVRYPLDLPSGGMRVEEGEEDCASIQRPERKCEPTVCAPKLPATSAHPTLLDPSWTPGLETRGSAKSRSGMQYINSHAWTFGARLVNQVLRQVSTSEIRFDSLRSCPDFRATVPAQLSRRHAGQPSGERHLISSSPERL